MCEDCGCAIESVKNERAVSVLHQLNDENNHQARHNRAHFKKHKVLCLNLMSSPGSGKTKLLEAIAVKFAKKYRMAVIEGDLETENDAQRIRAAGIQAIQINTSTACHLDAHQIHHALHQLPLDDLDILFIENVGNLVCPAGFDLGQHKNIVLLASTEGDDKPAKYPVMFRAADLILISKSDLLPVLDDFSVITATDNVRKLANHSPCFSLSAKTGAGIDALMGLISQWHVQQQQPEHKPEQQPEQALVSS